MDNPVPSTSKEVREKMQEAKKSGRKRKASRSSSSSSSTSSSSTDSSSSSGNRKQRSRKRKNKNRKFDKLFDDISKIKQQLSSRAVYTDYHSCANEDYSELDANVSGELFEGESYTGLTPEPIAEPAAQVEFRLAISTKTKEPHVPQAPPEFVEQLNSLQRFNNEDWRNVRYLDVQKHYVHKPGFVNLQPNDEVARYDASSSTGNMEKAFAGITYGLLKQRDALQNEIRDFLTWARQTDTLKYNEINDKLQDIFSKGEYVKTSNDTLQLVCGHRAELIQKRRETILASVKDSFHKAALRKVPPSASNLFEADKFSSILEKAGGTKKVFWDNQKDRTLSATQNDPFRSSNNQTQKPPAKSEGFVRPTSNPFNYKAGPKPQRGSFQGRGTRGSRGRREDTYYRSQRTRSPVSHRDRGGQSKRRKY